MKLKLSDRILTALIAVLFLLGAAAVVAEGIFGVAVSPRIVSLMSGPGMRLTLLRAAAVVICLLLCLLCLCVTFRRKGKDDQEFVLQTREGGQLRVSVKAIEGLVRKHVGVHNEMILRSVEMINRRDGLSVAIVVGTAENISIPLAVSTLQKQLREYILESTGVELRDIHVDVDNAQEDLTAGTYRFLDSVIDPEESKRLADPEPVAAEEAVQAQAEALQVLPDAITSGADELMDEKVPVEEALEPFDDDEPTMAPMRDPLPGPDNE